jgi:Family of unknown function (DUF6527)
MVCQGTFAVRAEVITPAFVEYIPGALADQTLYISQKYKTAAHKCCCGCGTKIVTPITPTDWTLTVVGNRVTLDPSIGNWNHPCQSHYFIRDNGVVWAGRMSKRDIKKGRKMDKARKDAYFADAPKQTSASAWLRLKRWVKSLFS